MSFLNLMGNRLKPKEVNDVLTEVQGRTLPVTKPDSVPTELTPETKTRKKTTK